MGCKWRSPNPISMVSNFRIRRCERLQDIYANPFQTFSVASRSLRMGTRETDHLAEGSQDLMRIQYDRPQAMLNRMLGDWKLIYPKYSMGLWQEGRRQS